MDESQLAAITAWVTKTGLAGAPELDLVRGFCERVSAAGLPLSPATVIIDTLHPIHEGRAFRWGADQPDGGAMVEFGRTTEGEAAETWRRRPGGAVRCTISCAREKRCCAAALPAAIRPTSLRWRT